MWDNLIGRAVQTDHDNDILMDEEQAQSSAFLAQNMNQLRVGAPSRYVRFTSDREDRPEYATAIAGAFAPSTHGEMLSSTYGINPPSYTASEKKRTPVVVVLSGAPFGDGPSPSVPPYMWDCVVPDASNPMIVQIPLPAGYHVVAMMTHPGTQKILQRFHKQLLTGADELGMTGDNINTDMGSGRPNSLSFARVLVASAKHINEQYAKEEQKLAEELRIEQQQEELQKQAAMTAMQLVGAIQSKSGKYDAMIAQLTHTTSILANTGSRATSAPVAEEKAVSRTEAVALTGQHTSESVDKSKKRIQSLTAINASQSSRIRELESQMELMAKSAAAANVTGAPQVAEKTAKKTGAPSTAFDVNMEDAEKVAIRRERLAGARAL